MAITYHVNNLGDLDKAIANGGRLEGKRVYFYEGCVLTTREENGYDDSDFYAIIWDEKEQCIRRDTYASTRYAGGGHAEIDATPEVREKAAEWNRKALIERMSKLAEIEANAPRVGKVVEVVKGKMKGVTGVLGWIGKGPYNNHWKNGRVGLDTLDGERVWNSIHNLQVVNPEEHLRSQEEIEAHADRIKEQWHTLFASYGMVVA